MANGEHSLTRESLLRGLDILAKIVTAALVPLLAVIAWQGQRVISTQDHTIDRVTAIERDYFSEDDADALERELRSQLAEIRTQVIVRLEGLADDQRRTAEAIARLEAKNAGLEMIWNKIDQHDERLRTIEARIPQ